MNVLFYTLNIPWMERLENTLLDCDGHACNIAFIFYEIYETLTRYIRTQRAREEEVNLEPQGLFTFNISDHYLSQYRCFFSDLVLSKSQKEATYKISVGHSITLVIG